MKLKAEQIGATFYHPNGKVIELTDDSDLLDEVYQVAPTLFEEEEKQQDEKVKQSAKKK